MANLFSDNFNRADSTNLGTGWTERLGDWEILTNQLNYLTDGTGTAPNVCHTSSGFATADYSVSVDMGWSSANGSSFGPCGRRVNNGASDSNCYWAACVQTGGAYKLYKRVAGTYTQLGTTATVTTTLGTMHNFKLSMQGTTIKAVWDGVDKITVTDSSLSAAGDAGIAAGDGSTVNVTKWDNFSVDSFVVAGRLSRYGDLNGLGGMGQMTYNPME